MQPLGGALIATENLKMVQYLRWMTKGMFYQPNTGSKLLLAGFLTGAIVVFTAGAQTTPSPEKPASPGGKPATASTPYRNQPDHIAKREAAYYEAIWGIADPSVKAVESGVIIRFSYRILDPEKARLLNDKRLNPLLVSPERGVQLVVPTMEKVGQLRQAPHELEAGKSYWMAFSNSGRVVKRGDRVDIVIGNFHARGLQVE